MRLIAAGLLSALAYGYLAFVSNGYGAAKLIDLYITSLASGGLCLYLFYYYWREQRQIPVVGLLAFAILFRIIGIFAFPVLEDDIYRYLWDGRLAIELGTPYGHIPADFFDHEGVGERFENILGLINYPDVATIYGPLNQWVFAFGYLIAPGQIWPLQVIYALADIALIAVLLKFAKPNLVLLYAWSPLIIKEFSFTAHPDVLGALLMLLAVLAYTRQQPLKVAGLLALAAGVKIFALLLVPLLLRFNWRAWLVFIASAVLIALPWGVADAWLPQGLREMGSNWLFNAPLYILFGQWFAIGQLKLVLLGLFVLAYGIYYLKFVQKKHGAIPRADILYAMFFLAAPAVNAWYLVWLLPFAVIYPSVWAWVASFSILLAYASGINLAHHNIQAYAIPAWIVCLEYGLVVLAVAFQWRKKSPARYKI